MTDAAARDAYAAQCKHPSAACFEQADSTYCCGRCNTQNVTPRALPLDERSWMKGS